MKPVPWGILMKNFLKSSLTGNSQQFGDDSCQQINTKTATFVHFVVTKSCQIMYPWFLRPFEYFFCRSADFISGFMFWLLGTSFGLARGCLDVSLVWVSSRTSSACSGSSAYRPDIFTNLLILWSNYLEWPTNVTYDLEILGRTL